MPSFTGVSHIELTVRDTDLSAAWYERVLGMKHLGDLPEYATPGVPARVNQVMHMPTSLTFGLIQHDDVEDHEFNEFRVGLDHVALTVDSRDELEQWVAHLDDCGVAHSGIKDMAYGSLVVFRDPDNIQLELFASGPELHLELALTSRRGTRRGRVSAGGDQDSFADLGVEGRWLVGGDDAAVPVAELDGLGVFEVAVDLPLVVVQQSVVSAAEQDEVVEVGQTVVDPVLAVMALQPAGAVASGCSAVPVAVLEESEQVGRHRLGASTEPEWDALGVFDEDLADRVTGEPAGGVVRDRDALVAGVEVRTGRGRPFDVRGFGSVNEHARPVWPVVVIGQLLIQRVDESIGAAGRERVPGAVGAGAGLVGATSESGFDE